MEYTTEFVTQGHCETRPTVTLLSAEHSHNSWPVLIYQPTEGRRLSWPEYPVAYQDGITVKGRLSLD